jgi:sugar lactone lactonase YvrE
MNTTHTELSGDLVFPEGLRWHDGRLWFSDIHTGRVLAVDPHGNVDAQCTLEDDYPSGLGFLPDGSLLVAAIRTRQLRRFEHGRSSVHADLSEFADHFINDMVTDDEGRTYVGSRPMARAPGESGRDRIILVRPDGRAEIAADNVTGPNGMIVTPDGSTLIVAETHAHRITAFERFPDGRLGARRTFADLGPDRFPDGISLDESGAVWAATGFGQACIRIADGGEVTDEVPTLDERWVLACVLGGNDRRTLYLATVATTLANVRSLDGPDSRSHADHDRWVRSLSRGWIEQVQVAVPGAGIP